MDTGPILDQPLENGTTPVLFKMVDVDNTNYIWERNYNKERDKKNNLLKTRLKKRKDYIFKCADKSEVLTAFIVIAFKIIILKDLKLKNNKIKKFISTIVQYIINNDLKTMIFNTLF